MGDPKRFVRDAFAAIAPRYDRLNTILSLGVERHWRRRALRLLDPRPGERILDLCAGTLTLSRAIRRRAGGPILLTALDFCMEMLLLGRSRLAPGEAREIQAVAGDGELLPVREAAFDGAFVSYGLRNIPRPEAALHELGRVLRPGGRLVILDFLRPRNPLVGKVYGFYLHRVLPRVGGMISGAPAAYRHLADSIQRFMEPEVLLRGMGAAGFENLGLERYSLGIAGAFHGWKVPSGRPPASDP